MKKNLIQQCKTQKLSFLFLLAFVLLGVQLKAQSFVLDANGQSFSFNNANRTLETGTVAPGLTAGSVHRYSNVATISGRTLYARVTIVSLTNTTITNFDDESDGTPAGFQPVITTSASGFATYRINFFDTLTNFPVYIYNYYLTGMDVDGTSVNSTEIYRLPLQEYTSYSVGSGTQLVITSPVGADTQFRGRTTNLTAAPAVENTAAFYAYYSRPKTSITFSVGANGALSDRQVFMRLGIVPNAFTGTPVTTNNTPPAAAQTDLAIAQTVNNPTAPIGSNVTFTITATNNGPSAATNVNVGDLLPSGFTFVSSNSSVGTTYTNATGIWTIGNLANAGVVTLTITARVNATGSYVNNAGITGNEMESNIANNSSSATVVPSFLDSDGDTVPDYLDLDSDNDGILDTVECPPTNIVTNGTFDSNLNGWTAGTGWVHSATFGALNENNGLTGGSALSQTVTGLNGVKGSVVAVNLQIGAQDSSHGANTTATLEISLNNTVYAILTNSTARNTTNVTLATSNGATSTFTTFGTAGVTTYNQSQPFTIYIPYTGPNSTTLSFRMISGDDDWSVDNVSINTFVCDFDGDGIPNYLDLDSDGDGCTDAIEGGAPFTNANLTTATGTIASQTPNQNLGNTVGSTATTRGVPTVAGTGQTVAQSQDATRNDCIDSDNDGIPDWQDLDDDNDGILDTIECTPTNVFANFTPATIATSGTTTTVSGITWGAITGTLTRELSGVTVNTSLNTQTGNFSNATIYTPAGSATQGRLGEALTNFNNTLNTARYTLALSQPVESITLHIADWDYMRTRFVGGHAEYLVSGGTELVYNARQIYDSDPNSVSTPARDGFGSVRITSTNGLPLSQLVFEKFDDPNTSQTIDGFSYTFSVVPMCDTDGDGIPNRLDLDSDGDGCTDAIEGGAAFTNANLTTAVGAIAAQTPNQNLGNTVGDTPTTIGVPTIAGTGQTAAQSQDAYRNDCIDSDGDNIPDWQDLDDDNDGILDSAEVSCLTINAVQPTPAGAVASFPGVGNPNFTANFRISTAQADAYTYVVSLFGYTNITGVAAQTNTGSPRNTVTFNRPVYSLDAALDDVDGSETATLRFYDASNNLIPGSVVQQYVTFIGNQISSVTYPAGQSVYVVGSSGQSSTVQSAVRFTFPTNIGISRIEFEQLTQGGGGSNNGLLLMNGCVDIDTDGDGIPNRLDLDSDGDGCSDAIEGGSPFTTSNLATSSMPGGNTGPSYNGLSTAPVTQNLGNTVGTTATTIGVPTIATTGQTVGQSQNGSRNDCQDADADGIPDWQDLDDDNDGILDAIECPTTASDFVTAFQGGTTINIVPSDFGLALNVKNQNVTRDISAKFGYPINSGAVIVSITNASVHPTVDTWWTKNGEQPSIWKVTGTMSAFVGMGHDFLYYSNDSKTTYIYDNANVIAAAANQTAVAGQWSISETQSQKTLNNLNTNNATTEQASWQYLNMNLGPKSFGFSTTVASADPNYAVTMLLECDTDKDGIPDRLDLDSDGDGCSDAFEGAANITTAQLVTAGGTLSGGSTTVNQNLCATGACVSATGVPQFGTVPTNYSNTNGQGIGTAQNALENNCYCYRTPATPASGTLQPVKHGITALNRAGSATAQWPTARQGAWTVLESKTKGFVVNRMAFSAGNPVGIPAANFIEGMMVYDTTNNCLKVYTSNNGGTSFAWHCMTSQTCPN